MAAGPCSLAVNGPACGVWATPPAARVPRSPWLMATAPAAPVLLFIRACLCAQHPPELREVQVAGCLPRRRCCHVPARRRAVGPIRLQQSAQHGQSQRQLQDSETMQPVREVQAPAGAARRQYKLRAAGGGSGGDRGSAVPTSAVLQPLRAILHVCCCRCSPAQARIVAATQVAPSSSPVEQL